MMRRKQSLPTPRQMYSSENELGLEIIFQKIELALNSIDVINDLIWAISNDSTAWNGHGRALCKSFRATYSTSEAL